jgi:hypothetical protein
LVVGCVCVFERVLLLLLLCNRKTRPRRVFPSIFFVCVCVII